jgi:hypothetical protein
MPSEQDVVRRLLDHVVGRARAAVGVEPSLHTAPPARRPQICAWHAALLAPAHLVSPSSLAAIRPLALAIVGSE